MRIVTRAQLRAFAGRGYLVLPGLVTPADLDRAAAGADRLIAAAPPADGHVGRWAECLTDPWHEYASIRPLSQA